MSILMPLLGSVMHLWGDLPRSLVISSRSFLTAGSSELALEVALAMTLALSVALTVAMGFSIFTGVCQG